MILSSTSSTSKHRPPPWQPAGAAFIARGCELAVLEGDRQPERLVLLEFPDLEAARRFYESPQYQEAKRLRDGAAARS